MHRYKKSNILVQSPQNAQEQSQIKKIESYRETIFLNLIYLLLCLATGGLFYLLTRWYLKLQILVRFQKSSVLDADFFLIYGEDKSITLSQAFLQNIQFQDEHKKFKVHLLTYIKIFEYRFYKYYFDDVKKIFIPIEFDLNKTQNNQILRQFHKGILHQDQLISLNSKFGPNSTAIPDKGIISILIDEILSPFYIFSIFSIIVWYQESYYIYATIILLFSLISISVSLHQYLVNFDKLQAIAYSESKIKVHRFCQGLTQIRSGKVEVDEEVLKTNKFVEISSNQLVPGDLICIEDNQRMPCDLILITGQSVMDESMLTGECNPILKISLPSNQSFYNIAEDGRFSTLFAGTICIVTKFTGKVNIPVLGVVTQTGFKTLQGQLIRSIMFTSSKQQKFYKEAMKYIIVLAMVAVLGFLITLKSKLESMQLLGIDQSYIIVQILCLITITVPPAMPIFLQISISISLIRLKNKQIFCISPLKINTAGNISVMCFDKTGTLTEDCLDVYGILTVGLDISKNVLGFKYFNNEQPLTSELTCTENLQDEIIVYECKHETVIEQYNQSSKLLMSQAMSSCHGLILLQGQIIGDPLDIKVFERSGSKIQDGNESEFEQIIFQPESFIEIGQNKSYTNGQKLEIVRKFDFQSKLQRMSVIVQTSSGLKIFCKGSPEKIRDLCIADSLPKNYLNMLQYYTKKGFRVIAIAARILKYSFQSIKNIERDKFECNLTFIGFIIFENKLKPITQGVIQNLQNANIRTIMATGDNLLTAISVARSCNIIKYSSKIYFGDLEYGINGMKARITWKDFDRNDQKLQGVLKQQPKQFVEFQKLRHKPQIVKNKIKKQQSSVKVLINQQDNQSLCEQEKHTVDAEPWQNSTDDYVLALSGAALNHLIGKDGQNRDPLIQKVLDRAQVYARINPEDKGRLIKQLQTKLFGQPLVGFCGDGANDIIGMKSADMGISIGQAEASIAASFTSLIKDISCVPILLCEGRAAIKTTFICFKYMILYSIIEFTTACTLYLSLTDLTNNQYLYADLITVLPISMTMGLTYARTSLTKQIPNGSLMNYKVICSVVGQASIQVVFQIIIYIYLLRQDWLVKAQDLYLITQDNIDEAIQVSYETTTMFLFTNMQYVFTIIAFTSGSLFRQPFYTNLFFTICCFLLLVFDNALILFYDSDDNKIYQFLGVLFKSDTTEMPKNWIIFIVLMSWLNGFISILYERVLINNFFKLYQKIKTYKTSKNILL